MDPSAWQPHVDAMLAFYRGDMEARIVVHDDYGDTDEHSIAHFFRTRDEFPALELAALELCCGTVLDVGAGSGCHSIELQKRGLAVCALEIAPELCRLMRERGVLDVRCGDIHEFESSPFDTVLMMMNGLELAGSLAGLERLLSHLHSLVSPGGQVLADSTDLRSSHGIAGDPTRRKDGRYVGEATIQLEYDARKGMPFQHLYVDPDTLAQSAAQTGWDCAVSYQAEFGHYLARLSR
jgi:SAM-dependent methyltransferase